MVRGKAVGTVGNTLSYPLPLLLTGSPPRILVMVVSLFECLVRRFCLLLLCLALSATVLGCGLFPKDDAKNQGFNNSGINAERLPPANTTVTSRNAVLAGQVIDVFNQRRGGVQLTLQPVDGGEPVTAMTNDQGYFTVASLQAGKRYRIQARSQQGTVQSTGSTEATAPNVVVLIKLNDAKTETDAKATGMSGSVGGKHSSIAGSDDYSQPWSRGNPAQTGRGDRLGAAPDVANPSNQGLATQPAAAPTINPRLGKPVTTESAPAPATAVPVRPEYVADEPNLRVNPVPLSINGPGANAVDTSPRKQSLASSPYLDFPLLDLDGKATTLAMYRGRLTLVDLWNTDCIPCSESLPQLMKLHRSFGPQGLVVVGISVNERGKAEDNAAKIRWRAGQKGVDYPLLTEQPGRSAMKLFNAEQVPTLILLDETGKEVWRGVGFNPDTKQALEQELIRRLR